MVRKKGRCLEIEVDVRISLASGCISGRLRKIFLDLLYSLSLGVYRNDFNSDNSRFQQDVKGKEQTLSIPVYKVYLMFLKQRNKIKILTYM